MRRFFSKRDSESELLDVAWGIIANAGWDAHSGETTLDKTPGWHDAAIRWRDDYFAYLKGKAINGTQRRG